MEGRISLLKCGFLFFVFWSNDHLNKVNEQKWVVYDHSPEVYERKWAVYDHLSKSYDHSAIKEENFNFPFHQIIIEVDLNL